MPHGSKNQTLNTTNKQKVTNHRSKPENDVQRLQRQLNAKEAELKIAHRKLERLEKLYDAAFYSSAQLASISDLKTGKFIDVNDAWVMTRGFRREEVIGKTADDLKIWGDDQENREKILADIEENGRLRDYETKSVMRNGEIRDFILNAEILCLDGRNVLFFSGVDITDRKRIFDNQHRTQKLEAIGHLSGGIAHDFNNLLGIIQGNIELVAEQIEADSPLQNLLNSAVRSTERGEKITKKMLGFSSNNRTDIEYVNANEKILGITDLVATSATAAISVTTELTDAPWPLKVDAGDLEDTLINLCLNAQDAMPDGGELTLRTENTAISAGYARLHPEITAGDYVAITVKDTGQGIDRKTKEHMFEPFFTTKKDGHGSGLGLSMVFGFVKRSKGHIKVSSLPGKGCYFTVFLPRTYEIFKTQNEGETLPSASALPGGNETLLLVDDEQGLVNIARSKLESLGYIVFTAFDGQSALQIIREFPEIDLLLTDIVMPGETNGFRLAVEARALKASMKILLTSGHSRTDELLSPTNAEKIDDLADNILSKPYSIKKLAITVRETLDSQKKDRYIQAAS